MEKHYTIHDAAALVGVGKTRLKEALRNRELSFRKFSRAPNSPIVIPESELQAWLEKQTTLFRAVEADPDAPTPEPQPRAGRPPRAA